MMKRAKERKWHSWLNGAVLTTCSSIWGRQRWLWWTSGETLLTTLHWPSTARLWRESAALNSWGWTSQRTSPDPPTPCQSQRCQSLIVWPTNTMSISNSFFRRLKRASLPTPILTTFYGETIESVLTSCITIWYGNCSAARPSSGQWTQLQKSLVPLSPPSWIFSLHDAPAKPIVSWRTPPIPPTVSSSSYHQEDGSGASEPAPSDCSTAFSPGSESPELKKIPPPPSETPCTSWNMPPPQTYHITEKNCQTFFAIQSVLHTVEWACTNHL